MKLYVMQRNIHAISGDMARGKIYEPTHPHFLTCTVLHWLPIFTNQESVQIVIDSLTQLKESDNLTLFYSSPSFAGTVAKEITKVE